MIESQTVAPIANGYTVLPPGKLANAVTWLEMRGKPEGHTVPARPDLALQPLRGGDVDRYLRIFRAVGDAWLWSGRLALQHSEIAAVLDAPQTRAFALVERNADVGLLEISFKENAAELDYFGVVEQAIGRGIGRWLMAQAIALAWSQPIERFWLHTCSFDSPAAIGFYRQSGFTPYQVGFEIMDDPRLNGQLPRTAGAHVPMIEG
ncbi:GNAT family N-acetyltransferase [Methylovirgula sp. 4M-Z18]|uniref:GNAT family N-acetyltransferase n=1 Tax=Methylovirgula sp. 4M-Z18 TaxID=2293567 RepID=UPI001AECC3FB|nr:GNAT family N-acetyltransferase [Methylovirgula sp. 4M-Z18]